MTAQQNPDSDPNIEPGIDAEPEADTGQPDEATEGDESADGEDDSRLPHPPATATEQLDEGVAAETDEGPEQGTSPGAG